MQAIFISYRREDSEGQAGRLYDFLAQRFGRDSVFMDVTGIDYGVDFSQVIEDRIAKCAVLLVVIGRRWVDARDKEGRRRLEIDGDFVRLETAKALGRKDVTVIPVLIGGAGMPEEKDLPADLAKLAKLNATTVSHQHWDSDLEQLARRLEKLLRVRPAWLKWAAAGVLAAAAAGAGGWYLQHGGTIGGDDRLELAEKEARLSELARQKAAADLEKVRLERLAAEERNKTAQIDSDAKRRESDQAAQAASAAAVAAERARQDAEKASAEEKAKAEEQARRLAEEQKRAKDEADAKAAEAAQVLAAAQAASAAAAEKADKDRLAQAELAKASMKASEANEKVARAGGKAVIMAAATAAGPAAVAAAAAPLAAGDRKTITWPMTANCRGRFETQAQATITIEPAGDGATVTVQVEGTAAGRRVTGGGKETFAKRQESYPVPITATWKGDPEFQTSMVLAVGASGGTRFTRADGREFRTRCPAG